MLATAARTTQAETRSASAATAPASAASTGALHRSASPALSLSSVIASPGVGVPLGAPVRGAIERSTGADLAPVRVHEDARSASAVDASGARAVAYGHDVFLGTGESGSDLGLMAHEATHVLQQQGAAPSPQRKSDTSSSDSLESEANRVSSAVQAGERVTVHGRTGGPRAQLVPKWLQRIGGAVSAVVETVTDIAGIALSFVKERVNSIPGFRMFTIVLGVNPVDMSRVERSAANILRAVVEFLPGGELITKALDAHGIFDKVGAWVEQQIGSLGIAGSAIKQALTTFIKGLQVSDIADLGGVWNRAKKIFSDPIDRIIGFAKSLIGGVIKFIKDAILRPIAKLAQGTAGYDLLKGILGEDPITGDPVPRTAETLIGPFMKLIGREEVWENMKKANAMARAWTWFQKSVEQLKGFVRQIPSLFVSAFKALELADIVLVPRAFAKLAKVFGGFLGKFAGWAGNAVWTLLEIIFDSVSPGAFGYIKKTGAALKSILTNPLPFVGNLVKAAKLGFQNFADRFGTHLKAGLIDWLVGALPGVYIPKAFELGEIVKFVFSVLGLSWQNVRQKLVKVLGETAVKAMETGFDIVITLVTQGPAAAWEKIKEQLTNLKDMVIGGITDFVIDTVVKKAIPKLIAMFIPGAGFISAILSIYDTVMVFVNKIATIIQVVKGFIDSIVAIAAGAVDSAAKKVESILANLLSLAINFLAGFAGLGKVADKVMEVINKVRATIDKGLDALVAWIVKMAKSLFGKAKAALTKWWKARKSVEGGDGEKHTLYMEGEGAGAKLTIKSNATPYRDFVNDLKTPKDKSTALKLAVKVDAAIAAAAKANAPAKAGEAIEQALSDLATATVPLLGAKAKSTAPVFGGLFGGFGSSATVLKLTSKHDKGGPPTVSDNENWAALKKRRDGKGSYYVRGHLLNHNLGGPGNKWENLTPLTQYANNRADDSMLKLFEKPIKDATAKGIAINFAVTAKYGRSHPLASQVAEFKKSDDAEENEIGRIIEAEKFVPISLRCKGSEIDADGKIGGVVAEMTVDNVIQDREDDYYLTGKSKEVFKINRADEKDLRRLYGIDAAAAKAIASKRGSYSSFEQVMKAGKLTAAQWKAARETPRLRVVLDL